MVHLLGRRTSRSRTRPSPRSRRARTASRSPRPRAPSPRRRPAASRSPRRSEVPWFLLVRIATLVPSATEMLFALGLGDDVVAVTHECDYPPEALELAPPYADRDPRGPAAAEIDRAVRERTEPRRGALRARRRARCDELDARPDRHPGGVRGLRRLLRRRARGGRGAAHPAAGALARPLHARARCWPTCRAWREAAGVPTPAEALARRGRRAARRGRAWPWPASARPRGGGAGVARPGLHRRPLGAADDRARRRRGRARPARREVAHGELGGGRGGRARGRASSMPCGYYAEQAAARGRAPRRARSRRSAPRVVAVDAAAYFSRPGPRLVDGVELLGHLLHPDRVPAPPSRRSIEVDLGARAAARGSSPRYHGQPAP